jgi:hypothetical protein
MKVHFCGDIIHREVKILSADKRGLLVGVYAMLFVLPDEFEDASGCNF